MRLLLIFAGSVLLGAQSPATAPAGEKTPQVQDRHSAENQDRQRGQTRPPDESQSWTRGRLGTQKPLPGAVSTYTGVLVDASCQDRSVFNLHRPPTHDNVAPPPAERAPAPAVAAPEADAAVAQARAHGVNNQPDRGCSVNTGTRSFALLTPEGRLLNLDEGGNTLAMQALHATPGGRAMLNGTGGPLKPQANLRGRVLGDRLVVEKIVKL
jgi:hypothetical protein